MTNPLKDILDGIEALRHTQDAILRNQIALHRIQEKILATLQDGINADARYKAAVDARDQRQKAEIATDESKLTAQAQALTDLQNHVIPDDTVAAVNAEAAAIEAENAAASASAQQAG